MASNTSTIRALLVGVDDYKTKNYKDNLHGCVRDINMIQKALEDHIRVPSANITKLISPLPEWTAPKLDDDTLPTKKNVLDALDKISNDSKPGDFVYIHYSGHGSRKKTKFSAEKGENAWDEYICTLNGHISDVKFGRALDTLSEKQLVVFAVLDCCHSGGATRSSGPADGVRCFNDNSELALANDATGSGERGTGERKTVLVENTWFNTRGNYNIIAACQPHEVAREISHDDLDGLSSGVLTYHFVKSLEALRSSEEPMTHNRLPITYNQLMGKLQAILRETRQTWNQQPMHLGDGNKTVFGTGRINDRVFNMSTNVVKVNKESVSFRDGNASGINIGDRFFIYDPSQTSMGLILPNSDPVAEVEVTKAFEFSSVAGLIEGKLPKGNIGSLEKVKPGWLARMSRRAHAATVYVDIQDPKSPLLEAIKTASFVEANDLAPLSWTYPPKDNSTIPDYSVSVDQNTTFEIRHKDYGLLPHIPSINANGSGPRKLVYLLQHISMYHATMKLKPKAGSVPKVKPKFDLNFEDVSDSVNQEGVVSAWEITFTNKDQKVLYVTILDLDSAYGISQTYPEGSAASVAVDIGGHFTYRTGIAVPDLLQDEVDNPEFCMEDVFKVIITDEQASFSHLELPDLENPNDLGSSERKTVSLAPRQAAWYVAEKIIRYPN